MKKVLLQLIMLMLAFSAGSQIIVSGEITSNTTWTNNNVYIISGWLYVRDGAVLTIEPGTLIKGDFTTKGSLIIERGAQLIADGTAEEPIVFTSQKAVGERYYGDWGGVILCGRASINVPENIGNGTVAGENIIEGGVGSVYGGGATPDDNDNSGILRYVRIEFGGIAFQPNSEINGLTCGGVGRGTVIDHVQVSYSGDDAFEFFGGTVNCTNLIAHRNWDDDFDTDFGYNGSIQWAVSVRDPEIADQSGSNGFESDNDGQGTGNTPITSPVFSNVTIIGPYAFNQTIASNYKRALHLRRNTKTSVFNSVFAGYPTGLLVDGTASQTNAGNNDLRFKNSVLTAMSDTLAALSTGENVNGSFDITSWYNNPLNSNGIISSIAELMLNDVNLSNPDLTLMAGSPLESGADFSDSYLNNGYFQPTSYRGAFGSDDWTNCWAEWDPQNAEYNNALNYTITANIAVDGSTIVCPGEEVMVTATTNSTGELTFSWNNGSTGSSISVMAPASLSVTVTNDRGCSAASAATELSNYAAPSVTVSANGPTSFCTGGSVVLTSSQVDGNVWSNTAQSSEITVTTSGSYSLVYTDDNGCVATSNSIDVSVSDSPSPTIATNGSTEFCEGESVELTSSTGATYQWNLNGQPVNNGDQQNWTATTTGAYTVSVTNVDQCDGTGTSGIVFVTVNPTPTALFDYDTQFGSGTYEFNNNSTSSESYSWDFGDGFTSTDVNPTHTFTTGGSHTVTLVATNGDCTNEYSMNITDVNVIESEYFESISVYPNPSQENTTLNIVMKNSNDVVITILDITGKTIYALHTKNATGVFNTELPTSQFEAGMYLINTRIGNSSEVIKLIVQ